MALLNNIKFSSKMVELINFELIKEKRKYKKLLGKDKYKLFKEMVNYVFSTNNFTIDLLDEFCILNIELENEKVKCVVNDFINENDHMTMSFILTFENKTDYNSNCNFFKSKEIGFSSFDAILSKGIKEKKGLAHIRILYNALGVVKHEEYDYNQTLEKYKK